MRSTSASEIRARLADGVRARLGIDTRSLAAFRVSLGIVVLINVVARTRDIAAFYTRDGVLPLAVAEQHAALSGYSLYALSDSLPFVVFLFAATALAAVALAVGYRTRLASVAVLVLVFSLNARNPLVMNGGDALLTRLLFWGVFLPLGARWSLDARRRGDGRESGDRVLTAATVAVLSQVVVVYAVNAVFKLRSDLWTSGEAVLSVFRLTAYTTWLGSYLTRFPELLVALNLLWVVLLVASPLLVLLTGRGRALLLALFVGAQFGLLLTMNLAVFPLVSVAGLLVFTPPVVWEAVSARLPSRPLSARTATEAVDSALADSAPSRIQRLGRTLGPTAPPVPSAGPRAFRRWHHRAVSTFVAVCLLVVLLTNASAVGYVETPEPADEVEEYVGYRWSLFAPHPPSTDSWYAFRAKGTSGEAVDPLRLAPFERDLRPNPYPNERWRKYLTYVHENDADRLYDALADYLCGRWEEHDGEEPDSVEMLYVRHGDSPETTRAMRRSCV